MALYLGIDLGTSGLKAVFVREDGTVAASGYRSYGIDTPQANHAQQDPQLWWDALCDATREAMLQGGIAPGDVCCVGLSGQMHSTVMLDAHKQVLHPAIIWCDQRSIAQAEQVRRLAGDRLGAWVQNAVSPGFQACSLLWMREHHPALYAQIRHVLLPKDYLRMRLTDTLGTDATDASSTLLFDCAHGCWSQPMLEALGIDGEILPGVGASCDVAGTITARAAEQTGLRAGTPVVFGGGDQPMQAVGNGILQPGQASLTVGTGGQILLPTDVPRYDAGLRTHTFCHANGLWYVMGATLSACLSLNWLMDNVLHCNDVQRLDREAQAAPVGSGGLIFLPYLTGERTPHLNPNAKGMFWGLQLCDDRATVVRAVLEGVAYSLLDAFQVINQLGLDAGSLVITGGGASSALWKQIIADVLGKPLFMSGMGEAAGIGAAICAMIGVGAYPSLARACQAVVRHDAQAVEPVAAHAEIYRQRYALYREIYQRNQPLFVR